MSKNVQDAIKEIETFVGDFDYLLDLASDMSSYEHLQEKQDFKELETIYYSMKKLGFTRTKFVNLLYEKVKNGELKMPSYYKDDDTIEKITFFVDMFFVNLHKYNSNREMFASYYIKGSEELMKLISSSKSSDVKLQNRGIRGLFSKKEADDSQNDELEKLISEKTSEVKNDKRCYNETNDIVEFLLDLQQMYPQYITLLSIEKRLKTLYYENGITWGFWKGYDAVKENPDRILKLMQEKIKGMNIPKGTLLEENSYLKHIVGKINDMFEYFKIPIKSSQLVSYDEFLSNPEFSKYISSIVKKDDEKKSKR